MSKRNFINVFFSVIAKAIGNEVGIENVVGDFVSTRNNKEE